MKTLYFAWLVCAVVIIGACLAILGTTPKINPHNAAVEAEVDVEATNAIVRSPAEPLLPPEQQAALESTPKEQTAALEPTPKEQTAALEPTPKEQTRIKEEEETPSPEDRGLEPAAQKRDFSYLAYYVYSKLPLDPRPADIVLASHEKHFHWDPD